MYTVLTMIFIQLKKEVSVRHSLDTPEGKDDFWSEMRMWCHQNYGSVTLNVEEDNLVFLWAPAKGEKVDLSFEAREIARNYLVKRAKYGGQDNYAACEIRHPVTHELLGASAIFLPRL